MLKFYYSLAPNPMKVALFLEEAALPYEAIAVDTRKGEQHLPAFTALRALQPRHVHYKVCSTFDSSSTVGSIGRAIEIGREVFKQRWVPLLDMLRYDKLLAGASSMMADAAGRS